MRSHRRIIESITFRMLPSIALALLLVGPARADAGRDSRPTTTITADVYCNIGALDHWVQDYNIHIKNISIFKNVQDGTKRYTVRNVPVGENTFQFERVPSLNPGAKAIVTQLDVKFDVRPNDHIKITLTTEKGVFKLYVEPVDKSRQPGGGVAQGVEVVSIAFDQKLTSKVIKRSAPITLARGTSKTVADSLAVTNAVTTSKGWNRELQLKGKLPVIEAGLKLGVEQSTSRTYGVAEERERSVTIHGDGRSKIVVVWVKYYRTGTATMRIDGDEVEVPFEIEEDFDLLTEEVE
jgi:hypothetical protein